MPGSGELHRRRGRRPVMADVARLAGVSHQTVSRVLNNSELVRAETRARVLLAIDQLSYRPNRLARALATGRSRTLGVVTFNTVLYGPASTLLGIERAAHAAGYGVSIVSMETLDGAALIQAVAQMSAQRVDGILLIAPHVRTAELLLDLPVRVPCVAVEAGPERGMAVIAIDQVAGAAAATRHLLALGHRTVWHLAGPDGWLEARARIEGWRSVLDAAGLPAPPVQVGDWSARSGYALAAELVDRGDVTAVFAANDHMALGLLRRLHERAVTVPGEISVVGFDDIPESAYFNPPLTTVRQEFGKMGRLAVLELLGRIEDDSAPARHITVDVELHVRESTGRARGVH